MRHLVAFSFTVLLGLIVLSGCQPDEVSKKPNILFCISDDQSWIHTSIEGTSQISTPNFDRVAEAGILFANAHCAASSCAPSRAAILTGQEIYRLEEGGLLFGGLPNKFSIFTELLRQNGYQTALTGKGYSPANQTKESYWQQPIGKQHNDIKASSPDGISSNDYAANFAQFFEQRNPDQPFFFWYGSREPHRAYKQGIGAENGKDLSQIDVSGFLPDNEVVRGDLADYYFEIEWFDRHLGQMINLLEEAGELDNTIILVTADNGMPFPHAKTTCYNYGTHMPLAICWGDKINPGRRVSDFISFTDFAPTLLEAAGIDAPEEMTGTSFMNVLLSEKSGQVDPNRNRVFTALERHTYCRPGGLPYPIRTIQKGDWLYIHNFEPDRWPGGDPDFDSPHQGIFGDIDAGPTREFMIAQHDEPTIAPLFELSFGKRPSEELYNLSEDPFELNNLADQSALTGLKDSLKTELFDYLRSTNDPRMSGASPWDDYPYYHPGYETRHLRPVDERDQIDNSLD